MIYKKADIPVDFTFSLKSMTTSAEKGDWVVEGYAATSDVDLVGDLISPEALKAAEGDLVERSTLLHNHHVDEAVGKIVEARAEKGGLWIKAVISKTAEEIWKKIQEGVLNKFSIRAKIIDAVKKFDVGSKKMVNFVRSLKVVEASIVAVPVNSGAGTLNAYVQKAMEEYEMESGSITKDPLDQVLDAMEEQGLINKGAAEKQEEDEVAKAVAEAVEAKKIKATEVKKAEDAVKAAAILPKDVKKIDDSPKTVKKQDEEPPEKKGRCKSYKADDCPVKELPESGEVPPEASDCSLAADFTCPYMEAEKAIVVDKQKMTADTRRDSLKDKMRKLMMAAMKEQMVSVFGDLTKGIEDEIEELAGKIDLFDAKMEMRVKALEGKQHSFQKLVTSRKSVQDNSLSVSDSKKDDTDLWKGALPF